MIKERLKEELEDKLVVGTKIVIGQNYAKEHFGYSP